MTPKYESSFTQRVIEEIENARLDQGMSVQELISKSGIRRSSYFRKMRGETTFTTEDVDALTRAIGLDPFLILRRASSDESRGPDSNVIVGGFGNNVDAVDDIPENVEEEWIGRYAASPKSDIPEDHTP